MISTHMNLKSILGGSKFCADRTMITRGGKVHTLNMVSAGRFITAQLAAKSARIAKVSFLEV